MKIKIFNKNDLAGSKWSGGETTELLIYPESARYAARDFLWRVSTATVEAEESAFTSLPAYARILMVLEGKLKIEHEAHYTVELAPFQQDEFSGGWISKSYGRATDFNIMMKAGVTGAVTPVFLEPDDNELLELTAAQEYAYLAELFYFFSGDTQAAIPDVSFSYQAKAGDFLALWLTAPESRGKIALLNIGKDKSVVIRSRICF